MTRKELLTDPSGLLELFEKHLSFDEHYFLLETICDAVHAMNEGDSSEFGYEFTKKLSGMIDELSEIMTEIEKAEYDERMKRNMAEEYYS